MPDEPEVEDGETAAAVNFDNNKRFDRFKLVYEPTPIVPPDGGYGWAVVAAAFVVNLVADGVTFSFGILLSELFTSLNDSREDISWIGSFLAGIPLLLGPVTSVLIDRYGCRAVTMAGGLISGLGFVLIFFLPKSTLLFVFSAGLLTGFGLGLAFMPAVVAVSYYFLERRALATGLAMSGSGVGTVVFAYITRACIEEYTWQGGFLIIGGMLLNVCVCGALYRPLEPPDFKQMKRMNRLYVQFQQASDVNNAGAALIGPDGGLGRGDSSASLSASTSSPGSSLTGSPTSRRWRGAAPAGANSASAVASAKSVLSIPTYLSAEMSKTPNNAASNRFAVSSSEKVDEKRLIASLKFGYLKRLASDLSDNSSATVHANHNRAAADAAADAGIVDDSALLGNPPIVKANTSHELFDYAQQISRQQKQRKRLELKQQHQQQQLVQRNQHQHEDEETRRMSIMMCLPQQQQPQQQQQQQLRPRLNTASQTVRRQLFPVDRRYFMQHTRSCFSPAMKVELWDSCPEFGRPSLPVVYTGQNRHNRAPPTRASPISKLWRSLEHSKTFKDVKFLFTSWDYISFLASNFLLYFWYDITYTFLPDHAKEIGLSNSDVSLIIALIGVSNTIGQIVIGYIGDFPSVNTVLLYALCMSLTGVANFLVPWCRDLISLLAYGIIYGFLVSANYSLCSIVIIDLFNMERLTTGYGFMMFFQGVANLVGPPAMGHMRDSDSNYNRAFIFSGIFVLVSNLIILPMYRTLYQWASKCCCSTNDEDGEGDGDGEGELASPLKIDSPLTQPSV